MNNTDNMGDDILDNLIFKVFDYRGKLRQEEKALIREDALKGHIFVDKGRVIVDTLNSKFNDQVEVYNIKGITQMMNEPISAEQYALVHYVRAMERDAFDNWYVTKEFKTLISKLNKLGKSKKYGFKR